MQTPRGETEGGGSRDTSRTDWRPAAAIAAAVLLASVVPVPGDASAGGGVVSLTDPFHLLGYAALAAALVCPVGAGLRERIGFRSAALLPRTAVVATLAALASTAFGLGVEVVQAPIPWRSFAVADAVVNAVGALIGAAIAVAWWGHRKRA
ncbi:VanZ family protein [Haloparvum sedimenti]|uniref:VanZ family protein n=1 Tax=Haloparvum sedimenti TaxID=1678448 RepID=UPI00071E9D63|nr:VanZ family protein [Haloparvum sedimenti]